MIEEQLKKIMHDKRMNLKQLANESGLKTPHLCKIRKGSSLSVGVLIKLADTLECSTDELLGR